MDQKIRTDLQRLFPTNRILSIKDGIIILPYIPIGILLVCLRFCLLLNFLIARQILGLFFTEENAIFKTINHVFLMILGIRVTVDGAPYHARAIMCNKRSHIDGFVFSHTVSVFCEDGWNLAPFLSRIFRVTKYKKTAESFGSTTGKESPIVIFPEVTPTSGLAIMQLQTSYFQYMKSVQVATITSWRVLPISLSTAHSGFLGDLFWTFFCPLTAYKITMSKKCMEGNELKAEDFADAVASEMARMLGVPTLPISHHDKNEYLKTRQCEKNATNEFTASPELREMMTKVQEVAPHVPTDVILKDLSKTNSVDVTLTNIFEGVVKFTPIEHKPNKKSSKTPIKKAPQTPFEKRKADMYELARKRYKEAHGL